jgi:hypothetical protein
MYHRNWLIINGSIGLLLCLGLFFTFIILHTDRTPWAGLRSLVKPLPTRGNANEIWAHRHPMPRVAFKPTTVLAVQVKTVHALDGATTVIDKYNLYRLWNVLTSSLHVLEFILAEQLFLPTSLVVRTAHLSLCTSTPSFVLALKQTFSSQSSPFVHATTTLHRTCLRYVLSK